MHTMDRSVSVIQGLCRFVRYVDCQHSHHIQRIQHQKVFYSGAEARYSPLILAALMIGHHFSISAFCKAPSASGVCWSGGGTSRPKSAMRVCTFGSAIAAIAASLSLAMMSFGVPFGTHRPYQTEM